LEIVDFRRFDCACGANPKKKTAPIPSEPLDTLVYECEYTRRLFYVKGNSLSLLNIFAAHLPLNRSDLEPRSTISSAIRQGQAAAGGDPAASNPEYGPMAVTS
jgi:hypothetical protein